MISGVSDSNYDLIYSNGLTEIRKFVCVPENEIVVVKIR